MVDTGSPIGGMGYAGLGQFAYSLPYIGGLLGGMFGSGEYQDRQNLLQGVMNDYDAIQSPKYSALPYENQDFNPDMYQTPESAQYQQAQLPSGTREAQMAALDRMRDMGEGYGFSQNQAMQNQAIMNANQSMKANRDAAMMNAKARGVGGSGVAMALAQQGNQAAANNAMMGGLQGAQNAALQRLQSAQDYSSGLGGLRNQDTDLASRNADIINKFNMYNTGMRNAANQGNVDMRNKAGMFNTGNFNQGQQFNIGRSDQNANNYSNFLLNKSGGKLDVARAMVGNMQHQSDNEQTQGNKNRNEFYQMMGGMS